MTMTPPNAGRSEFLRVRGLRHHLRIWGRADQPTIFLGHGFLDVSATFAPMINAIQEFTAHRFRIIAPDWRGFGHTEWPQDGYWFHDYVADLDAFVEHYAPQQPVTLIGHSMGSQIVSLLAGLRPERVDKLVLLDGITLPDMPSTLAPKRFRKWLDQLRQPLEIRRYPSFEDLAGRVRRQHPQLSDEQALFIAHCWGREDGHGRIMLCADPKHRLNSPGLYHAADSDEVWRQATADTLFIDAGKSEFATVLTPAQRADRFACFRKHRVETIADAGHMLHFDAPRETARLIADFLAR